MERVQKKNVLVVDRNKILGWFLANYFKIRGYRANSIQPSPAEVVMGWLRFQPHDAVIIEVYIEDNSGLSLIRSIRTEFPEISIIVFSGLRYSSEFVRTVDEAGADAYVLKGQGPREVYGTTMRAVYCKASKQMPQPKQKGKGKINRHGFPFF